jgi:uncharacterized protein (TIGR03435 family)
VIQPQGCLWSYNQATVVGLGWKETALRARVDMRSESCLSVLHESSSPCVLSEGRMGMLRSRLLVVSIAVAGVVQAQSTVPEFEVASVRVATPQPGPAAITVSGATVTYRNTTLKNVLARAFEVKFANQITGPAWITTERYDIAAKASDGTPREQIPAMFRALLIERFQLTLRLETQDLSAYDLVVGKGKLRLEEAANPEGQKNGLSVSDGRREAKGMTMTGLAQMLSLVVGHPVLDRSGLSGSYNFPLDFSSEERDGSPDGEPSIFTIINSLGLRLESTKAPLEVITVVDGNKAPRPN